MPLAGISLQTQDDDPFVDKLFPPRLEATGGAVGKATAAQKQRLLKTNTDEKPLFPGLVPGRKTDEGLPGQAVTNKSQEETFHSKPAIKLVIPDLIKALLVDDWENVTKNQQLVPLPAQHSVTSIMADYLDYEKPKRQPGSAQADILEEVIAGLKEYFEKCLGRILLYR